MKLYAISQDMLQIVYSRINVYLQNPIPFSLPTHLAKQIYCCFLFLSGACLFGTLVSQINDILMTVT